MNGWALAVVLLAAFGIGYLLRFGVCVFVCSERTMRLANLLATANTDHTICQLRLDERDRFIASQERLLDQFRAGKDTADEAEKYLRERGGS